MNTLLIFFALPIATIIISIALQKILKCPPLVAGIIFSIFLIVTFIINNLFFLVAAIVYAILAFITAALVCLFSRFLCQNQDNDKCSRRGEDRGNQRRERRCECNCGSHNDNENDTSNQLLTINSSCGNLENGNLLTISSNGCNGDTNELLTISNNCNGDSNNGCGCNNGNNNNCPNNNTIAARINLIPNVNNNGRTGCLCGQYRRR